ncbi:LysE family translocator [uncultured Sphingomonas sp.]|uniref:LysE family translocator n=1 Tax=uncultured Sphingomonas sp. TaxID=158754 RepID=UPI0025F4982D|nr:LysE family translocator [uncultured Sphingomonas sp.]
MTEHSLLAVYVAYSIAAGSPGPSNLAIMNVAMGRGRRHALALGAGVITMSAAWGLIAATGLSALLTRYAQALVILKIAGGVYLLWLGFKAARSALSAQQASSTKAGAAVSYPALYRRGVLMHLGNPKSVLAWLAIMSLGVGPEAATGHVAAAYGGCVMLGLVIFASYALLFSTEPLVRGYARARRYIEGTLAIVFAGAGTRLILSR